MAVPGACTPEARMSELYRRNIELLGGQDVLVASHGGAGQSIVGNMLLELRRNYVDPYNEALLSDGTTMEVPEYANYQRRLSATAKRADRRPGTPAQWQPWPRFVKTHFTPTAFGSRSFYGLWLLVRDPRDALYSLYNWRINFAAEPWTAPSSFAEWLAAAESGDFPPEEWTNYYKADDWREFYSEWLQVVGNFDRVVMTRFEDLKLMPIAALRAALRAFDVDATEVELANAVDNSTFEAMRRHEDQAAAEGDGRRVLRKGAVSGWREWMTPQIAAFFTDPALAAMAQRFGYELPVPAP